MSGAKCERAYHLGDGGKRISNSRLALDVHIEFGYDGDHVRERRTEGRREKREGERGNEKERRGEKEKDKNVTYRTFRTNIRFLPFKYISN